jgi:hypothetical protein
MAGSYIAADLCAACIAVPHLCSSPHTNKRLHCFHFTSACRYDILYTRSQQITGHKLQALVGITNPHAIPLSITRVAYSISRPEGQQSLTGIAVCNETYTAAAQAAAEAAEAAATAAPGQAAVSSGLFGWSSAAMPAVKNAVTSFTLPPSPAAVAAAEAAAAAAAAASSSDASKSATSRFRLFGTQIRLDTSSSSSSDSSQVVQQPLQAPVVAAGSPTPYYCSFVVPTPDDFAAHVSVRVLTNKGEETETVTLAPVDWTKATLQETSR